jgi:hypothetical protein
MKNAHFFGGLSGGVGVGGEECAERVREGGRRTWWRDGALVVGHGVEPDTLASLVRTLRGAPWREVAGWPSREGWEAVRLGWCGLEAREESARSWRRPVRRSIWVVVRNGG